MCFRTPWVKARNTSIHPSLLRPWGILLHVVGRKADGIAKVVAHQARHYGIQVNNYDGLVSVGLKEDIVDLGVVMGHPQRQLSRLIEVGKTTGLLLAGLAAAPPCP